MKKDDLLRCSVEKRHAERGRGGILKTPKCGLIIRIE